MLAPIIRIAMGIGMCEVQCVVQRITLQSLEQKLQEAERLVADIPAEQRSSVERLIELLRERIDALHELIANGSCDVRDDVVQ